MTHSKGRSDQILSTFFSRSNQVKHVSAEFINRQIKLAVKATGLDRRGFPLASVSSHSLRAGGAMAMHLNGVSSDTIRKMGRWSSDTFLMYIHEQVSAFSVGISQKMATQIGWHNIEGPSFAENPAAAAA
jgi:integrase